MNIQPTHAPASSPGSPHTSGTRTDSVSVGLAKSDTSKTPAASVNVAPAEAVKDTQATDRQTLDSAVRRVKDFIAPLSNSLKFEVDDESGVRVVKVIDNETKDIIRQIPSEEMLNIARALDSLQGLLVRQQA